MRWYRRGPTCFRMVHVELLSPFSWSCLRWKRIFWRRHCESLSSLYEICRMNKIYFSSDIFPNSTLPCIDLAISTGYWESLEGMHILRINLRDHAYGNEKQRRLHIPRAYKYKRPRTKWRNTEWGDYRFSSRLELSQTDNQCKRNPKLTEMHMDNAQTLSQDWVSPNTQQKKIKGGMNSLFSMG